MIKNKYEVNWKRYLSWGIQSMFNGTKLLFTVFWCLMSICFLFSCIFSGFFLFYFIFFCFSFYRAFLRNFILIKAQYKNLVKMHKSENWDRTISFEKETIIIQEGNVQTLSLSYQDITSIQEKDNLVKIKFHTQKILRLYKDCFIQGDWESCKHFIIARQHIIPQN